MCFSILKIGSLTLMFYCVKIKEYSINTGQTKSPKILGGH